MYLSNAIVAGQLKSWCIRQESTKVLLLGTDFGRLVTSVRDSVFMADQIVAVEASETEAKEAKKFILDNPSRSRIGLAPTKTCMAIYNVGRPTYPWKVDAVVVQSSFMDAIVDLADFLDFVFLRSGADIVLFAYDGGCFRPECDSAFMFDSFEFTCLAHLGKVGEPPCAVGRYVRKSKKLSLAPACTRIKKDFQRDSRFISSEKDGPKYSTEEERDFKQMQMEDKFDSQMARSCLERVAAGKFGTSNSYV